jgi:NAD(P) transhydrogenase subunit alpha
MYSRNVTTFLRHMVKEGELQLDTEDQIIGDTMVSRDGQVTSARIRELLGVEAPTQ